MIDPVTAKRIEALEAENEWLRGELGLLNETVELGELVRVLGITRSQAKVFLTLYQRRGGPLTRRVVFEQMEHICDGSDPTIISVHVCRLRRQLGDGVIETVRARGSGGYRITQAGSAVVDAALGSQKKAA